MTRKPRHPVHAHIRAVPDFSESLIPLRDVEATAVSGIENLRSAIRGAVLSPSDPGYEAARQVHNGMIDRRQP
jgi:hypothetical protein